MCKCVCVPMFSEFLRSGNELGSIQILLSPPIKKIMSMDMTPDCRTMCSLCVQADTSYLE